MNENYKHFILEKNWRMIHDDDKIKSRNWTYFEKSSRTSFLWWRIVLRLHEEIFVSAWKKWSTKHRKIIRKTSCQHCDFTEISQFWWRHRVWHEVILRIFLKNFDKNMKEFSRYHEYSFGFFSYFLIKIWQYNIIWFKFASIMWTKTFSFSSKYFRHWDSNKKSRSFERFSWNVIDTLIMTSTKIIVLFLTRTTRLKHAFFFITMLIFVIRFWQFFNWTIWFFIFNLIRWTINTSLSRRKLILRKSIKWIFVSNRSIAFNDWSFCWMMSLK